jgi:glycosyltransferase involved in cell wall biosynthesis
MNDLQTSQLEHSGVSVRRVLFALSNFFSDEQVIGGAELGMLVVMKALRNSGVEPYVVMHGSGHFAKLLRREGIEFEVVQLSEPITRLSRNRPMVWQSMAIAFEIGRLTAAVRRVAQRWKIDVLHVHHPYGYVVCGLASKWMGIPCIWHIHEGWERSATSKMLEIAGRLLADHVVTIAPYEHSTVVALTDRVPHTMIENAFDFEELRRSRTRPRSDVRAEFGVGPSEVLVGYVSHLAPYKGQRTFVRALGRLAKGGSVFKAIIVGGPRKSCEWFQDELRAEVDELGLSGQILFCGTRLDIGNVMEAIDIFACVSSTEEFNRVLIEAMCFGKPVIASDLRGGSIVAETGLTGILVPPNDDESLAAAVRSLLDDSVSRARIGANGRNYVQQRFAVGNLLSKYEGVYDGLLADHLSTPRVH